MTQDEFAEYRYIIENALDVAKFTDRVNIILSNDTICIFTQRTPNIAVAIAPRGFELNIMYFDCGFKDHVDILNLAAPESILALGELLKAHLKVKYGQSQGKADLRQQV